MKNQTPEFYPVALTVAGSDSGGGAGIQADLRTFNALGVFGCSAITAVTSQNPRQVTRIDSIPPEGIRSQMAAVFDVFKVAYTKTGMLGSRAAVEAVAAEIQHHPTGLVVDPVMVATSGARLLDTDAVDALRDQLLPLADWLTPNLPEAELLLDRRIETPAECQEAARECAARWNCRCFLKTGHARHPGKNATDFIALPDGAVFTISSPRLPDRRASHGTGCTLSAALAALLAMKAPWKSAVCDAKAFVLGSLSEIVEVGSDLRAMYPPEEEYQQYIQLEAVR